MYVVTSTFIVRCHVLNCFIFSVKLQPLNILKGFDICPVRNLCFNCSGENPFVACLFA